MACSRCGAQIKSTLGRGGNIASPATTSAMTAPIVNRAALPPLLTRVRAAVADTVTVVRRKPKAAKETSSDG